MNFCTDTAPIWQFVGQILFVLKIVIPALIILLGAIDLGKAVISSKEDEIKKATGSLMRRFIAGVIVFFIPTIVGAIFGLFSGFSGEVANEYEACEACLVSPYDSTCDTYVDESNFADTETDTDTETEEE